MGTCVTCMLVMDSRRPFAKTLASRGTHPTLSTADREKALVPPTQSTERGGLFLFYGRFPKCNVLSTSAHAQEGREAREFREFKRGEQGERQEGESQEKPTHKSGERQ
jgi:hypothetical protein